MCLCLVWLLVESRTNIGGSCQIWEGVRPQDLRIDILILGVRPQDLRVDSKIWGPYLPNLRVDSQILGSDPTI